MDIRVLRYFLAVAREGGVTAAAKALNVTQPTLSRQMKELEEELGQALFVRGSHPLSLTAEGMMLRKRAEEITELVAKTKAEFQTPSNGLSGEIYIGGGETQGMALIADVIREMRDEYPDVHFHLYSGNAQDVTERLDKGLLDFGILIQPADLAKYDYLTLPVKDTWGVIMPADSPLARQDSVTATDLVDVPLICSHQLVGNALANAEFKKRFGEHFDKLNIIATYNLVFNAALLAEKGVGYVFGLDKLVDTADIKNVCFRPFAPRLESGMDIVWKKYQVFSPAARAFLAAVRKRCGG